MQVHTYPDTEKLNHALADWLVNLINQTLQVKPIFTLVLSGGNTPKSLYELLASKPYSEAVPWQQIHFFWGDERYVPLGDPRNNAQMAFDTLLIKTGVPMEHIHIMDTALPVEQSALAYEAKLHQYFNDNDISFDLVLLGLGDNGHTLSLFPYQEILHDHTSWVRSFWLAEQDVYRITLMPAIVNNAANIVYLVTGENKAFTVHEIIHGKQQLDKYPAQLIKPNKEAGNLYWFLDDKAAKLLNHGKNQLS